MIRGFFWDFARFWAVIALQFLFNMIHFTGFNLSPSYYILFILFFFSVHERSEWSLMFELTNYLSGILLPHYLAMFPRGLSCGCMLPVSWSVGLLPVALVLVL